MTGYHNPTLVLTLLAVAVIVWLELKKRSELRSYGIDVPRLAISVLKLVVICGLLLGFGLLLASYKGVPVVGLILGGLVILYTFITQRTVLGRHIYAVGGNSNAARLSGVDTRRVDMFVMVEHGLPGRHRRHGLHGIPQCGQPQGRRQLRARRDRGGLRRWRGRGGRRRHRDAAR